MAGKIILVTGGARSGKSSFAEKLAAEMGTSIGYIATAQIYDEEMRYRVKLHRERRPSTWQTWEAPFGAEKAIAEAAKSHKALLFDCLTLYLSNHLCRILYDELTDEVAYRIVEEQIGALVKAAQTAVGQGTSTIFVTNEVGAGIVPENHLARLYRDLSGLLNQQLADAAEAVYLTACGQAVNLKKMGLKAEAAADLDLGQSDSLT